MASVSTSHLILFIASMVVAASVAGTVIGSVSDVSAAIDDQSLDVSTEIRTDVEVISDPESGVYDGSNVTLYVKNSGSRTLPADASVVDVVVDGRYRTDLTVTVLDAAAWTEHAVARIEIDTGSLGSGDHRVKLSLNGDTEVFTFRT